MVENRDILGKAEKLQQYVEYLNILSKDESGRFKVQDDQEMSAVISNLERASKELGLNIQIKKRENYIYFFKEDEI